MTNRPMLLEALCILLIFLVFAGLGWAIDHSGEFPLNDDWGFSTPLLWYSEGKGVHVTYWQSMPYLTQLAIGLLWVDVVGFSYESLRNLTLIQAAITIGFSYGLARAVGLDRCTSLLVPMSVAASPVFFGLSFSFMSDISGAAFSIAACFFLAMSIKKERHQNQQFLAGGLLLLCAIAIRQNSLGIAIAFLLTHLVFFQKHARQLYVSVFLVAAGVALYATTVPFMKATIGLPGDYGLETLAMIDLVKDLASLQFGAFLPGMKSILHFYVGAGLLLLSLAPFLIARMHGWRLAIWVVTPIACTVALAALLLDQGVLQSVNGNILSIYGIGPRLIRGDPQEVLSISVALTFAGSMVTSLLLSLAVCSVRRLGWLCIGEYSQGRAGLFLILCGLGVYAPHGLTYGPLFDRYIIVPTILVSIGMFALLDKSSGSEQTRHPFLPPPVITSTALVFVMLVGSAVMTEDFFRWQRARYEMIDRAFTSFDAKIDTFSGGFEYDNLVRIVDNPNIAKDMVAVLDWDPLLYLAHPDWSGGEVIDTIRVDTVLPFGSDVLTLRIKTQ